MDNATCLGCGRVFASHKKLSSHEPWCDAYHQYSIDLDTTQRHLQKSRRKQRKSLQLQITVPSSDLDDGAAISLEDPDVEVQTTQEPSQPLPTTSTSHVEPTSPSIEPYSPIEVDAADFLARSQTPILSARSGRRIRLPARYADFLPGLDTGLRQVVLGTAASLQEPAEAEGRIVSDHRHDHHSARHSDNEWRTQPDEIGLFRVYPSRPTHIPADTSFSAVVDAPTLEQPEHRNTDRSGLVDTESEITEDNLFSAFTDPTSGLLMCWQYSGSNMKSGIELNRFTLYGGDPRYNPACAAHFNYEREKRLIAKYLQDHSNPFRAEHGWQKSSVKIRLPKEGFRWDGGEMDPTVPTLEVDNVYHRSIIDIIKNVYTSDVASTFHTTPFRQLWTTSDHRIVNVYSELYSSPALLDAYQEINALPRDPGDDLERVVVPLMMWSDSTHLANFGDASLWPFYLFFGSQSKYTRGKPTASACHHIAYIPKLPHDFQDDYARAFGDVSTDDVYTYCKRELIQEIWRLLLDGKFMDAYKNGIVIQCSDGVERRFFPRFVTYSADYPEKIILACIKFLGECPCPRCLVRKTDIPEMGTPRDLRKREKTSRVDNEHRRQKVERARAFIFEKGAAVNSNRVKGLLNSQSLTPTRNAFSERFSEFLFNFFLLFVVDLLHEFELGVWKAIFTHLMRILYAAGGTAVQELNWRYRGISTFGRGTIRKFHTNVSAMKRLAGRDFEDLLQCAIPAFEGLLPAPHNDIILDLLFDLACWHAYAKLRLHTDDTLKFFDSATVVLGSSVRQFKRTTCAYYHTTELPSETAARGRRQAALASKQGSGVSSRRMSVTRRPKELNLATYKYHALADYPDTIRRFGTTDNYNTQTGELEHRRLKRRYARSGKKNGQMVASIANQEAIERFIHQVNSAHLAFIAPTPRHHTSPAAHHYIAKHAHASYDITAWLSDLSDDPAITNFIPRLKDHLLARLQELPYDGDEHDFSDTDRDNVLITENKIYEHKTLRVNYTTYDLRREQDTINPGTHPDVMVLSHEDDRAHPYWYARVICIFHVDVEYRERPDGPYSRPRRMDFLFIRWFRRDGNFASGFGTKRLPRLEFFDEESLPEAFGFLDPCSVMRGVHLIPAFAYGATKDLLRPSFVRPESDGIERDTDWRYFYVNIFADRDTFMRFRGGGVGHKATRDWDTVLQRDEHRDIDRVPPEEVNSATDGPEPMEEGSNEHLGDRDGDMDEWDVTSQLSDSDEIDPTERDAALDDDGMADGLGYGAL